MYIYQKKIVKENDLFFFDDLAQRMKYITKNIKPNINVEAQPSNIIRNYCGFGSQLLKNENNRHFRSKSQIYNVSPIMNTLIPKEIKTIIIKLDNQKESKNPDINNKNNNFDIKSNYSKTIYDNKSYSAKQNKNEINMRNSDYNDYNDYNTNYISLFIPEPKKRVTRNKSVIITNSVGKNENNRTNISLTGVYKKSFCIDKPNRIKVNKERSTTAPKEKLNMMEKNEKFNKKIIKNISTPNIHNIIDLNNIPKNTDKHNTNIFQNININNNINNLNVLQYNLPIPSDKSSIENISKFLSCSNNTNNKNTNPKIKIFNNMEGITSSKIRKTHSSYSKNNFHISKFNDIIDNMNTLFAPTNINYIQKYINENNNKNQFLQNKILDNIATIKKKEKSKNNPKNLIKKGKLITEDKVKEKDLRNKIKNIYSNHKNGKKCDSKNFLNENQAKIFRNTNANNNSLKDEIAGYDVNVKNNNKNDSNKKNLIKSIPLKLNSNSKNFFANISK